MSKRSATRADPACASSKIVANVALAIPTGRYHLMCMMLIIKIIPTLAILALAAALVVMSLPAPLYA